MFGLGITEVVVIGVAALLIFGPKRLPELAKSLGKGIRDFKGALEGKDHEEDNEKLPAAKRPENSVTQASESKSGDSDSSKS